MPCIYRLTDRRSLSYAELACDLFTGCSYRCRYCFARFSQYQNPSMEYRAVITPKRNILDRLKKEAEQLNGSLDSILLSFTCDPYPFEHNELTREALKIFEHYDLQVRILTKAGMLATRDFDIIKRNGWEFGSSFSYNNTPKAKYWEQEAPTVEDRIEALKMAHKMGIYTRLVLEPVIEAEESIALIHRVLPFVNEWYFGKLNSYKDFDRRVDWIDFVYRVRKIMQDNNCRYVFNEILKKIEQFVK